MAESAGDYCRTARADLSIIVGRLVRNLDDRALVAPSAWGSPACASTKTPAARIRRSAVKRLTPGLD